jgi:hypothetical protein
VPDEPESDRVAADGGTVKKNWTKIAIAIGPMVIIATVVWEYARTNPSYNFLIEPWSLRGYQTGHGAAFVALGIILLIGGLATSWERSLTNSWSMIVATYFVLAGAAYAFVFAGRDLKFDVTTVMNVLLSTILAAALAMALRSLLGERVRFFSRALPIFILAFAAFAGLIHVTLVGNVITTPVWPVILLISILVGGLSITIKPVNMAANRMLMFASVGAWGVILLSAGAIRQSLIDTQAETEQLGGLTGLSVQYKDTQAAAGWWLAGFGVTILFVGAVGLWAKRRDIVSAIARARKQREAAEISTKEIADAAEAYAAEKAAQA